MTETRYNTRGPEILRMLMEARRLSQNEVARRTGITQPSISRYLARLSRPDSEQMVVLQEVLGVPVESWVIPASAEGGAWERPSVTDLRERRRRRGSSSANSSTPAKSEPTGAG